jgi:hypothetical protein
VDLKIDTQLKFVRPEIIAGALYLKLSETVSVGGPAVTQEELRIENEVRDQKPDTTN